MNPLKKAASLLKGKSVKQVQIDSDSESEVDSKSSTPVGPNDRKKKNIVTSPSVKSPTPSTSSALDDRLTQMNANRRASMTASSPATPTTPTVPVTPTKAPSDRSITTAPQPVAVAPPPPVEDPTLKFQQKIAILEQEVSQLKVDKRNLEQSLTESQKSINIVKETSNQAIKALEKKIAELTQEEEEMRTELFSKYDEIHALLESKERLNTQYLEVAKQLKLLESEALGRASVPPPPVAAPAPLVRRDEEIGDLKHQLKEMEEKVKTHKSLIESKQLMNMKLDGRNRELIQQLDIMKSQMNKIQHEGHEKDTIIEHLKKELADYKDKYDGPYNIDKRKIAELVAEIDRINEALNESERALIEKEENHQKKFVDTNVEMEFLRKLVGEYEAEIASLEKMLEEESSEMTQLLIRMKGRNEGLYRFLQAIFRRYSEYEKMIEEQSDQIKESPRDHAAEEKEKGTEDNSHPLAARVNPPQPILDLQDLIFLLDSNIMTMKVKAGHRPLHQMLTQLAKSATDSPSQIGTLSPRIDRSSPEKPSRPPPMSAGGKVNQEYTIRLLEFMDKYQISELEKHFRSIKATSRLDEEDGIAPASPMQQVSESNPSRTPSKSGSSPRKSQRKPPVMNTPPHGDEASVGSYSSQSTTSTRAKGSEFVCFTINRGDGRPDEKWLEIVDAATSLKYYFNPQTGVTQWELPIHVKEK